MDVLRAAPLEDLTYDEVCSWLADLGFEEDVLNKLRVHQVSGQVICQKHGAGDLEKYLWKRVNIVSGVAVQICSAVEGRLANPRDHVPRVRSKATAPIQMSHFTKETNLQSIVRPLIEKYSSFSLSLLEDHGKDDEHVNPLNREKLASTFIRLAIVKPEEDAKEAQKMGRQQQHELLEKRDPIALGELFAVSKNKRVVAQGRAGVGKSTMMKFICQQWALGDAAPQKNREGNEMWNPDFDTIILIELPLYRHVLAPGKTWEDLLRDVLPVGIDVEAFWKWSHSSGHVLWILDGVDEVVSTISTSILAKALQEKDFFGASLVLFGTRPEAKAEIRNINLCVEIEGFTNVDVVRYVLQYFDIRSLNPELTLRHLSQEERELFVDVLSKEKFVGEGALKLQESTETTRTGLKILKFLESSKEVSDMMRTPLNAELVCFSGVEVPDASTFRITNLYAQVVEKMISRALIGSDLLTSRKVMTLLATLAWKSLDHRDGFVPGSGIESAIEGLNLKASKEKACFQLLARCGPWKRIGNAYFWMHFTFQEYLAAHHVCCSMEGSELASALHKSKSFFDVEVLERGRVFYMFVCGIVGVGEPDAKNNKEVLEAIWGMMERSFVEWPMRSVQGDVAGPLEASKVVSSIASTIVQLILADGNNYLMKKLNESKAGSFISNLLSEACRQGNLDLVTVLLTKGAHPTAGLGGAILGNHVALVEKLIVLGAQLNKSSIGFPAHRGWIPMVELLILHGADVNFGLDPAVLGNHTKMVELLISKGADPNKGLHMAVHKNHMKMVELLISKGADPNKGLHMAVHKNQSKMVELLISKGADPKQFLHMAVRENHTKMVELLISKGADPNIPFILGISNGRVAQVELLLSLGADLHRGLVTATVLAITRPRGHGVAMVDLLISKGANMNKALIFFARKGAGATVKLLLDKGADASECLPAALFEAVRNPSNHRMMMVDVLISRGADVNKALVMVTRNGNSLSLDVVKLLLDKGADRQLAIQNSGRNKDAVLAIANSTHAEQDVVHHALCDVCNERIIGIRHKCLDCADYDECDTCHFRPSPHMAGHIFYMIENGEQRSVPAHILEAHRRKREAEIDQKPK